MRTEKKHIYLREVLRCVVDELIMNFYVNEATRESVLIFIIDVLKVELLQVVFDILLNYFLST
jgi:hypothetical protein